MISQTHLSGCSWSSDTGQQAGAGTAEEMQNLQTWKNRQVQGETRLCAGCCVILKYHYLSSVKPSLANRNAMARRDVVENAISDFFSFLKRY